jgi:hypothetical protein
MREFLHMTSDSHTFDSRRRVQVFSAIVAEEVIGNIRLVINVANSDAPEL